MPLTRTGGGGEVMEPCKAPKRQKLNGDVKSTSGVDFVLGTTKVEVDHFAFQWTIDDYEFAKNKYEIRSSQFTGGPKNKHSWQLKISPNKKYEGQEYLGMLLILTGFGTGEEYSSTRKIDVRFQFALLDSEGGFRRTFGKRDMASLTFRLNSEWGWNNSLLMKEAEQYVVNNSLRLHCIIWIEGEVKHSTMVGGAHPITAEERREEYKAAFIHDISKLLESTEDCDVGILVEETGSRLSAHKIILKARSPVLAEMFRLDPFNNEVTITEFDDETVKAMLEWVYTGKTGQLLARAPDLLQIADRYELAGLKLECEHVLADHVTVKNVSHLVVLGHFSNAPVLKERATKMMFRHKKEVIKTNEFKEVAATYGHTTSIFVELYVADI